MLYSNQQESGVSPDLLEKHFSYEACLEKVQLFEQ